MEEVLLLEDDIGIPEPEHLDMVVEGLADTLDQVAGNESYSGLTDAQKYVYSCLNLNNQVSRQQQGSVAGCEGFFSGVGDNLKKVWDYIVKMFKAITAFFFGGGKAEKLEKEAKDTVAKAEKALEEVGKAPAGGNAEQATNEVLAELRAVEGEGKKEAEEAILRITHQPDPAAKAKAAEEERLKTLPKINSRAKEALKRRAASGEQAAQAFYDKIKEDHSASFAGTPFAKMYGNYHKAITETNAKDRGFLTKAASLVHNLDDAKRAIRSLSEILGGYTSDRQVINQYKSGIESEIKQIETRMNDASRSGKIPKELKSDLRTCNQFLQQLNAQSHNLEDAYKRISAMAKDVCRLFGIKL